MALPPLKPVKVSAKTSVASLGVDLLVVVADEADFEGGSMKSAELKKIDTELGGVMGQLAALKDFEGKWLQSSVTLLPGSKIASRLLLVGGGKKTDEPAARARQLGLKISEETPKLKASKVAVTGTAKLIGGAEGLAQLALGFQSGVYKYPNSNLSDDARKELEIPAELTLVSEASGLTEQLAQAAILGRATDLCRLFQDGPPNVVTPKYVAEHISQRATELGLSVQVFGAQKLKELGFHAMLAVAGGSAQEPQFVVVEYKPASAKKTLAFVGKGLTMDTGGYSIKTPSTSQIGMKYDMSGAAVALSSVLAIAELKLDVHVYAVGALCENMIDAHSYRVGDVLKTYSGKTIEVMNTDAEGRIVLSDALSYTAKELKPDAIVEYSTLTGAMIVSLGHIGAGIFAFNDEAIGQTVLSAAQKTGERAWPMPVWEEVGEDVKGTLADVNNLGATAGAAGSIAAAMFLKEFVDGKPYAHVDIAGVANGNQAVGYPRKISSGYGIQLSVEIARSFSVAK